MSELNCIGMSCRKVPKVIPEFGVTLYRGRRMGTPYKPLDTIATTLLVGAALNMVILAFAKAGFGAVPFLLVFLPVTLGVALMFCRMGGPVWARVVAGVTAGITLIGTLMWGLWVTP